MLVACFYITPSPRIWRCGARNVPGEDDRCKQYDRGNYRFSPAHQRHLHNLWDVWHEWKEELRLDAKSKEEDMKSVELALQVIQNRTFMHVEIYDHFERYPAELLGQTEWKSLPIDSKEKVEVADASYSLHPFLGSLVEWRYWSIERFKYTPTNNEVYWSEGDGEREREKSIVYL